MKRTTKKTLVDIREKDEKKTLLDIREKDDKEDFSGHT